MRTDIAQFSSKMSDIISQYRSTGAAEETEKLLSPHSNQNTIPAQLSISINVSHQSGRPPNWIDSEEGDPDCKRACAHCMFNIRPWVTWVSTLCIAGFIRVIWELHYLYFDTNGVIPGLGAVALALFAVVYVISVVRSETWIKVSGAVSRRQLEDKLEVLYRSAPKITWHLQCFHSDDSHAVVTYSNGSVCVEIAKKKVITWSGSKTFDFKCWKDVTHPIQLAESGSYQIISVHKDYIFADEETRVAYESQKLAFINEHKHRDQLYSIAETYELDGFQEKIVAEISRCPCTGSLIFYAVMMMLLLAYPWSFLVKKGERRLGYHCAKMISASHEKISIAEVVLPHMQLAVSPATMDDHNPSRSPEQKNPTARRAESSWNHFLPASS